MEKPPNKGKYYDVCFRAVCNNEPATWYNHSTREYYCESCAMILNHENKRDAMRIFGHDLCTDDSIESKTPTP